MTLETNILETIIEKGNDGFNIIQRRNYICEILELFKIKTTCDDDKFLRSIRIKIMIPGREQFISTIFTHDKFLRDEVVMEAAWFLSDDEQHADELKFITGGDKYCIEKYYSIGEYIDNILKMLIYYKT
jgi:hypothetical protein